MTQVFTLAGFVAHLHAAERDLHEVGRQHREPRPWMYRREPHGATFRE